MKFVDINRVGEKTKKADEFLHLADRVSRLEDAVKYLIKQLRKLENEQKEY